MGEVLERPMDSGAHIEVEAVPKREYQWDPEHMGVEEQQNPLLAKTLEKLSEDHDIYVEVIEEVNYNFQYIVNYFARTFIVL